MKRSKLKIIKGIKKGDTLFDVLLKQSNGIYNSKRN